MYHDKKIILKNYAFLLASLLLCLSSTPSVLGSQSQLNDPNNGSTALSIQNIAAAATIATLTLVSDPEDENYLGEPELPTTPTNHFISDFYTCHNSSDRDHKVNLLSPSQKQKSDCSFVEISPLNSRANMDGNDEYDQDREPLAVLNMKSNGSQRPIVRMQLEQDKEENIRLQKELDICQSTISQYQSDISFYQAIFDWNKAVKTKNLDLFKQVWGVHLDPRCQNIPFEITPIAAFVASADLNSLSICKFLGDEKNVNVNDTNAAGMTPLIACANQGYLKIAKYLIEEKKADINRPNGKCGRTAIMFSIASGHRTTMVKYLAQNGADLETIKAGIKNKRTAYELLKARKSKYEIMSNNIYSWSSLSK